MIGENAFNALSLTSVLIFGIILYPYTYDAKLPIEQKDANLVKTDKKSIDAYELSKWKSKKSEYEKALKFYKILKTALHSEGIKNILISLGEDGELEANVLTVPRRDSNSLL